MEHKSTEQHLEEHDVKPTAVRMVVWEVAEKQKAPFTFNDMVEWLPDTDRTSIFRTLRTFAEHFLLHEINDGSGAQKYCVCRCHGHTHLGHVHFTCVRCGRTFCIEDQTVPLVTLPTGFLLTDAEYVIKGLCPHCNNANE